MRHAKCFQNLISIGVVFIMLSSAVYGAVVSAPSTEAVRAVVDVYLRVEYQEDTAYNREQLIKFSPRRQAYLEDKTEPGLGIYDFYINSGDPVFIVDAYKIEKVDVKGQHATATVSYNRLGRIMNGMGTIHAALIPDKKVNDHVTLNLVFKKNKWWVLDPPPPRVSRDVLILDYESELKWYEDRQKEIGKLPDHQQEAYDRKTGTLNILRSLP